jgi:twitching motility protein PilI
VRGNLYSVVDFAAFLGEGAVAGGEQTRLLLLGERFRSAAALLVDRSLGLLNPASLRVCAPAPDSRPWVRAQYEDEAGGRWSELDVAGLVRDAEFLAVGD